jgi:hypothetical protein
MFKVSQPIQSKGELSGFLSLFYVAVTKYLRLENPNSWHPGESLLAALEHGAEEKGEQKGPAHGTLTF